MSPLLVSQPERDQVKKLDPEIFLLSQSWPVLAHLTMSVISHWPDDWSCLEWKTFVSLWESCWWTQTCSWSPSNSSWWACWCWPYHCWVWRKTLSLEQMFPPSYFSESSLDQSGDSWELSRKFKFENMGLFMYINEVTKNRFKRLLTKLCFSTEIFFFIVWTVPIYCVFT